MSTTTQSREALTATRGRNYLPLQYATAILLAALTLLYSAAWMYYVRRPLQETRVEIGIDAFYSSAGVEIDDLHPNSPAEKAGLKTKDLIVAINGSSADSASAWNGLENRTWLRSQPGDTVTLTVRRPGQSQRLVFTPSFRAKQGAGDTKTLARSVAAEAQDAYPLAFLIVGLAVLFLRVEDRNAWLLALVFATFITAAPMPNEFATAPHNLRSFLLAYRTVANSILPGLFYFFFAVFPTRSPIDRRVPWLKWVLPVIGLCLGLGGYRHGNRETLPSIAALMPYRIARNANMITGYGAFVLAVFSLVLNVLSASSAADRRKTQGNSLGNCSGSHSGRRHAGGRGQPSLRRSLLAYFRVCVPTLSVPPLLRLRGGEASRNGRSSTAETERKIFCRRARIRLPDSCGFGGSDVLVWAGVLAPFLRRIEGSDTRGGGLRRVADL